MTTSCRTERSAVRSALTAQLWRWRCTSATRRATAAPCRALLFVNRASSSFEQGRAPACNSVFSFHCYVSPMEDGPGHLRARCWLVSTYIVIAINNFPHMHVGTERPIEPGCDTPRVLRGANAPAPQWGRLLESRFFSESIRARELNFSDTLKWNW